MNKFSYGDSVIVRNSAPLNLRPGEYASVCSVGQILLNQEAEQLECNVGDWIYTIEFEDGSSIQIIERYLDRDLGVLHGREITKYIDWFLGGVAWDIMLSLSYITIKIKSPPISQSGLSDIFLLRDGCLKGKVIIPQIEKIIICNGMQAVDSRENGAITAFYMSDYLFKLTVEWDRDRETEFEIKSGQIWWEQRE